MSHAKEVQQMSYSRPCARPEILQSLQSRLSARVVRRLVSRQMPDCFTVRYDDFGDYAPGRWAWLLRDIKPFAARSSIVGRQGFFDLPQGWMTADGIDG